ncbi:hypothetical protein A9Q99_17915 [Gammaproteobacteria bacterium 45_16_T64]|nr:hypothetical protein A9Q99_17915 [Gammaproteobacteria bacterium 45_16_T64]
MKKKLFVHKHCFHLLILFSLYFITSSITTHLYLEKFGKDISISTTEIMHNEANRPFAYRILIPHTLEYLEGKIPERAKQKIVYKSNGEKRDIDSIERYNWQEHSTILFVVCYLFIVACLVILQFLWRYLLQKTIQLNNASYDSAPAIAILLLPMTFVKGAYIYDFPELIFATLCLIFFLKKQWIGYYITFFCACINKETGVLLGAWFLPLLFNKEFTLFFKHAFFHCLLGLPTILLIRYQMNHLPGDIVQFNFYKNIEFWTSAKPWIHFEDVYAFNLPTPRVFNIINLALLVYPLSLYWNTLNKNIKQTFAYSAISMFPLYMLFGLEDEIRVFMIVFPSLFILYTQSLSLYYSSLKSE